MKFTKQEYADVHLLYGETRGNSRPARRPYASVFLKESFRPVVLLWSNICIYVRLVLTDSNTMSSPILHLTPLDFNFWGHTKDLVYEVEINTKGQLQKRVTDAANQIRKNPLQFWGHFYYQLEESYKSSMTDVWTENLDFFN
jgi:hypothetical protein